MSEHPNRTRGFAIAGGLIAVAAVGLMVAQPWSHGGANSAATISKCNDGGKCVVDLSSYSPGGSPYTLPVGQGTMDIKVVDQQAGDNPAHVRVLCHTIGCTLTSASGKSDAEIVLTLSHGEAGLGLFTYEGSVDFSILPSA